MHDEIEIIATIDLQPERKKVKLQKGRDRLHSCTYFLRPDRKAIVLRNGKIVTRELAIVSETDCNLYHQVYCRFMLDGVVWRGYTVANPPNGLIARKTRLVRLLDQAPPSKTKCSVCGKAMSKNAAGNVCAACISSNVKALPCCSVCGKQLQRGNKTGLCKKHYWEIRPGDMVYSGYYGFAVPRKSIKRAT